MLEIIIILKCMQSFRSIGWQGPENELRQGSCKSQDFQKCRILKENFVKMARRAVDKRTPLLGE